MFLGVHSFSRQIFWPPFVLGGIQYKKRPIYWSIILVAHNSNEFLGSTGVGMKKPTLNLMIIMVTERAYEVLIIPPPSHYC